MAKAKKTEDKPSLIDKIKEVNSLLKSGEPGNITEDSYSGMTGYSPQYIIDSMNLVFGPGNWGFKELSNDFFSKDAKTGKPTMAIAQVEVFIAYGNCEYRPKAYGQGKVTRGDFGDAKKAAQTDAIKKALSYFSVGNRAYHGKLSINGKKIRRTKTDE